MYPLNNNNRGQHQHHFTGRLQWLQKYFYWRRRDHSFVGSALRRMSVRAPTWTSKTDTPGAAPQHTNNSLQITSSPERELDVFFKWSNEKMWWKLEGTCIKNKRHKGVFHGFTDRTEKMMVTLTSWTETPMSKEKMHQVAVVTETVSERQKSKKTLLFFLFIQD